MNLRKCPTCTGDNTWRTINHRGALRGHEARCPGPAVAAVAAVWWCARADRPGSYLMASSTQKRGANAIKTAMPVASKLQQRSLSSGPYVLPPIFPPAFCSIFLHASQMEEKTGGNGDFTQRIEKHAISSNISSIIFLQMFPP